MAPMIEWSRARFAFCQACQWAPPFRFCWSRKALWCVVCDLQNFCFAFRMSGHLGHAQINSPTDAASDAAVEAGGDDIATLAPDSEPTTLLASVSKKAMVARHKAGQGKQGELHLSLNSRRRSLNAQVAPNGMVHNKFPPHATILGPLALFPFALPHQSHASAG